ncbi:hypothetical protein HQ590_04160 [bacterium]|nr:hypothetical protein [bacterium]
MATLSTTLPVPATARLHLPWQGCWQVAAGALTDPVKLEGLHLPLLAGEENGRWTVARLSFGEDDEVLAVTLRWQGDQLEATLHGKWTTPPNWSVTSCGTEREAVAFAQGELGLHAGTLLSEEHGPVHLGSAGASPSRVSREICRPWEGEAPAEPFARLFILDIHDPRGNLIQSFAEVEEFVRQCAGLGVAKGTVFYLPGWDGPFDATYPDYEPAADAGGAAGLARLVETARTYGGEVMPHLNHWAVSRAKLAEYPQFEPHILRDDDGERQGWPGLLWYGATNPLWYVDASNEQWLAHFSSRLRALEDLGIRVVMLDQVAAPLGKGWRPRFRRLIDHVRRTHPGLILASESVNSDLLGQVPLAQFWGPVWTGMTEESVLGPSPWLTRVLDGTVQVAGHLATPAPYPTRYAWTHLVWLAQHGCERAFEIAWQTHQAAGVLPTARLVGPRTRLNDQVLRLLFHQLPAPAAGGAPGRQGEPP